MSPLCSRSQSESERSRGLSDRATSMSRAVRNESLASA
jgi:hypothetical protein